ncbi:MAG: gephyrin-like molybdotransferase Glp [Chloroflexota bacterium]
MISQDIDRMLQPDEARSIVLEKTNVLSPEMVPIDQAGGRILFDALVADVDLPAFRASTMDGYAVVHNDDSRHRRIIHHDGFAGSPHDIEIEPGTAARIMTGAPVPDGATAVVMVENTETRGDEVEIRQDRIGDGENIRPVGSDMRRGDKLVEAGVRIGPAEIGLLASLGHHTVKVGRRPKVSIFSTGDELVEPHETPGPGKIRDSNRFSIAVAARDAGAEVVRVARLADDMDSLRSALAEALSDSDVLVTSGGVSMGDRDFVKALLGELAEVHFRRVFMKPGKPLNFATAGEKLIFGLPGNPVSSLASFELFVRPALARMQGAPAEASPVVPVIVTEQVQPSDRIEYQRALVWVAEGGILHAAVNGPQHSARLASWVGANALLIVEPADEALPPGSMINAILLAAPYAASTSE